MAAPDDGCPGRSQVLSETPRRMPAKSPTTLEISAEAVGASSRTVYADHKVPGASSAPMQALHSCLAHAVITMQFLGPLAACRVLQASIAAPSACTPLSSAGTDPDSGHHAREGGSEFAGLPPGSRRRCCVSCSCAVSCMATCAWPVRRIMFVKHTLPCMECIRGNGSAPPYSRVQQVHLGIWQSWVLILWMFPARSGRRRG